MRGFTFPGIHSRVVFGAGTLDKVGEEVAALGHGRALVLSTANQADQAEDLAKRLGSAAAGTFTEAAMHTPVEVTERAMEAFSAAGADCLVSIGGGSTIGLGKAIATRTGADHVAVPTTYAGSEMTDILGETKDGAKTTRRDVSIRPEVVVYDVDLTLTLPADLTVTSALNAIAHGVEALYAPDANPVLSLMSLEAMRRFKEGLPVVAREPGNREARAKVLEGAWYCSTALGYITMALHHKLAHVLGGSFGTPHAETHAILIPHTAAFNAEGTDALDGVAEIFGSVGGGLWDFARDAGAPMKLADLGMSEADLDKAAGIAVQNSYSNPRPFNEADIRELLQAAWEGRRPA
ncbi:maleylacetate reductase [Pseudoroseicyclus tamaricis]|uniref:Maleylacetate reductase n=1 Tax=Pseudoroseicyclus tamaricis TaxID=2705421 RepID=A0A6B2JLG7_9RHOB|nr:maleylacetate reductase [Pseudoroseicyclus tamaricis]NDV02401.1 maleylacetate reductase [Pseudoroseicyclus tamaricis]